AEDGIRAFHVTGVQTCALPIFAKEVGHFLDVEEINRMPDGAPSKRIAKHIPIYAKYKRSEQSGIINVLETIELHNIRRACNNLRSEERRVGKERRDRQWPL